MHQLYHDDSEYNTEQEYGGKCIAGRIQVCYYSCIASRTLKLTVTTQVFGRFPNNIPANNCNLLILAHVYSVLQPL